MVHPILSTGTPRRMTANETKDEDDENERKLFMVALGEEEIAQKAAKTGFWEHGFWGQVS
jgi:hypothetical protein